MPSYDFLLLRPVRNAHLVPTLIIKLGVLRQTPVMRRFIDSMVGLGWAPSGAMLSASAGDNAVTVATVNVRATTMLLHTGIGANDGVLAEHVGALVGRRSTVG